MSIRNTITTWGSGTKFFHWVIALLIIVNVILGWTVEFMDVTPLTLNLFVYHKSIGLTVLSLAIFRLCWKLSNPVPAPASGISQLNARLATLGHWGLYALIFAIPISGWILNSAANFPFKWFGFFTVPFITEPDKQVENFASLMHLSLFWILAVTLIGHIGMALFHHIKHKNNVLTRMLPTRIGATLMYTGTAIIAFALMVSLLPTLTSDQGLPAPMSVAATVAEPIEPVETVSSNPGWQINHETSLLGFTNTYADVEFAGHFKDFSGTINFDPDNLEESLFDITINTTTITTNSEDRDMTLPEQDWFDFSNYPTARYVAQSFSKSDDDQFIAEGVLMLKGRNREVPLTFKWSSEIEDDSDTSMILLQGEANIRRIDFGIGEGMWAEDDTVGLDVHIKTNLHLTPAK